MTFEHPARLFGLLLVLVLFLVLLIRRRGPVVVVPTLRLWEEALRTQPLRWRFRLRDLLSLLLAILACVALVGSAARPGVPTSTRGRIDLILVLDTGSSLRARSTPEAPSRFERALAEAQRLVAGLEPGDHWAVVVAGAGGQAIVPLHPAGEPPLFSHFETLLTPRCSPMPIEPGLRLASLLAGRSPDPRVVVLTDGVGDSFDLVQSIVPGAVVADVGGPVRNVGFVALAASPEPSGPGIEVRVLNGGHVPESFDLVDVTGGLRSPHTLDPGEMLTRRVSVEDPTSPWLGLRLELAVADGFPLDDTLEIPVARPDRRGVVVFSDGAGDPFLESALRAIPERLVDPDRIVFRRRSAFDPNTWDGDREVAVFDGCAGPKRPVPGPVLLMGSPEPGVLAISTEEEAHATVTGFARVHPINRGIPWESFRVVDEPGAPAAPLLALDAGDVVVRGVGGAMVMAHAEGAGRIVACAFRAEDTDLRVQPQLPLLIKNVFQWLLAGGRVELEHLAPSGGIVRFGAGGSGAGTERQRLALPNRVRVARRMDPDVSATEGVAVRLLDGVSSPLPWLEPGRYDVAWSGFSSPLGVNFLYPEESALSTSPPTGSGAGDLLALRMAGTETRDLTREVAGLGLLLMVASLLLRRRRLV